MKLSAARDCYYSHSGNASSSARQIAFAGIAVVWVFNQPTPGHAIALPHPLVTVLWLLCTGLACDLLQYTLSSLCWGFFARLKEKQQKHHQRNDDPDIDIPPWLNWPGVAMYWTKLVVIVSAYARLGGYLTSVWSA